MRLKLAWLAALIVAGAWLCLFATCLSAIPVCAKWRPQFAGADPNVAAWYAAQHNAHGEWCCDKADGEDFYGAYTIDPKTGDVDFTDAAGGHHHLPAYMVLTGPNPTGHAVWWHMLTGGAGNIDYCFAPGAGG